MINNKTFILLLFLLFSKKTTPSIYSDLNRKVSLNFFIDDNFFIDQETLRVFGSFQRISEVIKLSELIKNNRVFATKWAQEIMLLDDLSEKRINRHIYRGSVFFSQEQNHYLIQGLNDLEDQFNNDDLKPDQLKNLEGLVRFPVIASKKGAILAGLPNFAKGIFLTDEDTVLSFIFKDPIFRGNIFLNGGTCLCHNPEETSHSSNNKKTTSFKNGDLVFKSTSGIFGPGTFIGFGNILTIFSDDCSLRSGEITFDGFREIHLDGDLTFTDRWIITTTHFDTIVDGHNSHIYFSKQGKIAFEAQAKSILVRNLKIYYDSTSKDKDSIFENVNKKITFENVVYIDSSDQSLKEEEESFSSNESFTQRLEKLPIIQSLKSLQNNRKKKGQLECSNVLQLNLEKDLCDLAQNPIIVPPGKRLEINGNGFKIDGYSEFIKLFLLSENSQIVFKNILFQKFCTEHFGLDENCKIIFQNCSLNICKKVSLKRLNKVEIRGSLNIFSDYKSTISIKEGSLLLNECSSLSITNCNILALGELPFGPLTQNKIIFDNSNLLLENQLNFYSGEINIFNKVNIGSVSRKVGEEIGLRLTSFGNLNIRKNSKLTFLKNCGLIVEDNYPTVCFEDPLSSSMGFFNSFLKIGNRVFIKEPANISIKDNTRFESNAEQPEQKELCLNEKSFINIKNASKLTCKKFRFKLVKYPNEKNYNEKEESKND